MIFKMNVPVRPKRSISTTFNVIMRIFSIIGFILTLVASSGAQRFTDITESAGVTDTHGASEFEGECVFDGTFLMNSGCAFGDYNNDGFMDLYLGDGKKQGEVNVLYRNNGDGTFTDVTRQAGVGDTRNSHGVGFGDINNDGWLDIYVANLVSPNRLYLNNQDGTFSDISAEAGVDHAGFNTSFVFDDFNKDGWLDIYVLTYGDMCSVIPPDDSLGGSLNVLYINNKDGRTFTDMTAAADAGDGTRWSLAVTSVDVDNDGDQDIHIANDFKGGSTLLVNQLMEQGVFKFIDQSDGYGVGLLGNMMSAICGDIDNDGDFDFYSTNIRWAFPSDLQRFNGNALFRNEYPTPAFTNISLESNTNAGFWGWGSVFIDVDFDGWLDIFEVNGWPLEIFTFKPNLLFRNLDGLHFEEIGQLAGVDFPRDPSTFLPVVDSRGLARADIDNDGDEDIYIRNNRERGVLFRNDYAGPNHWIQFEARGTLSNRFAIGTKFLLTTAGRTRAHSIAGGHSFLSVSSPIVTFGLGQATIVDSVVVLWPSGLREVFFDIEADRRYRIVEGQGVITGLRRRQNDQKSEQGSNFKINNTSQGIRVRFTGRPGSYLKITVFNLLGQRIASIYEGTLSAPEQEFIWNGRNEAGSLVGNGVYFINVLADVKTFTKKVMLVR